MCWPLNPSSFSNFALVFRINPLPWHLISFCKWPRKWRKWRCIQSLLSGSYHLCEEANLSTAGAWCLVAALVIDESQIPVPCRSLYLGQMVVKWECSLETMGTILGVDPPVQKNALKRYNSAQKVNSEQKVTEQGMPYKQNIISKCVPPYSWI